MDPLPLSARFEDTRQCAGQTHHIPPPVRYTALSADTKNRLFSTCPRQTSGDPLSVESSGFGSGAAAGGFGNEAGAKRSSGNLSSYSSASSDSLCSIDDLLPNETHPPGSVANQVPCGNSAAKRNTLFPGEVRHLSVPTGTTSVAYTLPALRRQSSPVYSRHPDDWTSDHKGGGTRSSQQTQLISSGLNRLSIRTALSPVAPMNSGSIPVACPAHLSPDLGGTSPSHHSHYHHHHHHHHNHRHSALESIPQGQELEVVASSSSASGRSGYTTGHWDTELVAHSDGTEPVVTSPPANVAPPTCCPCRAAPLAAKPPGISSEPPPVSCMKRNSCPAVSRDEMPVSRGNNGGGRFSVHLSQADTGLLDHHSFSSTTPTSSHWARELVGRVRDNWSAAMSHHHHSSKHARSDSLCIGSVRSPDSIDPRRLPKAHGPMSASLQFTSRPLHAVSSHQVATSVPTSVLKSPSVVGADKQPYRSNRVRWFTRSGCDRVPEPESGQRSADPVADARLSSSAVEKIQDALEILAERCQPFSRTANAKRTSFRVRSASESEHLLVISKALSHTNEEQHSDCAFGRFNEKHAYNTLFRHSTCYDVLPDSGKLVMLDSRLGVLRGIQALLESGALAAVVWRGDLQSVSGLFTQEFALHLLVYLANQPEPSQFGEAVPQANGGLLSSALKKWGSRSLGDIIAHFCPNLGDDGQATSEHRFGCRYHRSVVVSPRLDLHTALFRLLRLRKQSSNRHLDRPVDSTATSDAGPKPGEHGEGDGRSSSLDRLLTTNLVVTETKVSGNVLGLVNADRLLAYLRVRVDDLPCPAHMSCPVGCLHGLRWSERWSCDWVFYHLKDPGRRHRRKGLRKTAGADTGGTPPSAVLRPSTLCNEAARLLSAWMPHLPCLPVVSDNNGTAAAGGNGKNVLLLGLVGPGDFLNFVLNGATDSALQQPLSKLLEIRPLHCRAQQDCICFTHEPISCVLDRMFHLRAPCLVLYDFSKPLDGNSSVLPVGLVTARDLLIATVLVNPSVYQQLKTKKNRSELSTTYPFESQDLFTDTNPLHGRRSSDLVQVDKYSLAAALHSPLTSDSSSSASDTSRDSSQTASSRSSCSCPRPSRDKRRSTTLPLHLLAGELGSSSSAGCSCACHHRRSVGEIAETPIKRHSVPAAGAVVRSTKPKTPRSSGSRPVPGRPVVVDQPVSTYANACQSADTKSTVKSIPDTSSKRDEDDIVFRMD